MDKGREKDTLLMTYVSMVFPSSKFPVAVGKCCFSSVIVPLGWLKGPMLRCYVSTVFPLLNFWLGWFTKIMLHWNGSFIFPLNVTFQDLQVAPKGVLSSKCCSQVAHKSCATCWVPPASFALHHKDQPCPHAMCKAANLHFKKQIEPEVGEST